MEISGVTKDDLAKAQTLQNILKNARLDIPVTDAVGVADTLGWYKDLCIALGKGYQKPATPEDTGLKVKDFHPGDLGGTTTPRASKKKK